MWWILGLLLIACDDKASVDSAPSSETPWEAPDGGVIALETRDGITLAADYYPASTAQSPAVVLLHMIPPSWDRSSWPEDFIAALTAQGWSVLAVDRRGAGDSEGEAEDAYTGEWGRYDVEAAALRLEADGAGALAVIGASNGTTSTIDYAVWAGGEGLPVPRAVGLMTGGTYTESQTDMANFAALAIPAIFTYSTEERAWSVAQEPLDPGGWAFREYPDGDHGTLMFDAEPVVSEDLVGFFADVL